MKQTYFFYLFYYKYLFITLTQNNLLTIQTQNKYKSYQKKLFYLGKNKKIEQNNRHKSNKIPRQNKLLKQSINIIISKIVVKESKPLRQQMSIYSGFATRTQQNYYDQVLYNVISTLLTRIAKFYRNEQVDEGSFFKIISNQEKTLRKLEKRKYLQPKYAELLEYFLGTMADQPIEPRKREMNRTLSVLDREFNNLRDANQKLIFQQKQRGGDAHSLTKIQQKIKRKKKSKSKKNSIKSNLDIFQFKAQKKMPQLPSLQPLQHMITRTKFNTKINFSEMHSKEVSRDASDVDLEQEDRSQRKASLAKPPRFRAKMYFREG